MEESKWEVGMEKVEEYVLKMHNMVTHYIATRTILDLCEEAEWKIGTWVSKRWWEQEGLDLEGGRTTEEVEDEEGPHDAEGETEGLAAN